jgi:dTDP-4-amino-4,6-dideoxygalactose transaminase
VTEAVAKRVLSLPMYAELTEADVRRVAAAVVDSLGRLRG